MAVGSKKDAISGPKNIIVELFASIHEEYQAF